MTSDLRVWTSGTHTKMLDFDSKGTKSPDRSRRSRRGIWFRESSPKEGDRLVAWCKLEWELGLSSGFTEIYSSRSPYVDSAFSHKDYRIY